ncbi:SidE phosphodiesterase domain-containing protein [Legionella drozanskii]|uniref:SidE PDE domain-containing protein n=1 Tax=Legionella drozanskii LLAP-1 TaxID=1212489 RepID=A0A0W0TDM7_9GAMM|nr:SidE phosphodiesterase domain-containing protein [Legionella drozanskii]KTC93533.1 hypothetical protein Ldro_0221 [Legionella drozanskii LLAP-1]
MYSKVEKQDANLTKFLQRKHLDTQLFESTDGGVSIDSPIEAHSGWAFRHIYSVAYNGSKTQGLSRVHHGIQHVNRACMYVPVIANLYRKHGDKEALALTPELLKLIQIAVIFHDSAREGEEKDFWDLESALFIFNYFTKILKVNPTTATMIAEAMANKDHGADNHYVEHRLVQSNSGITWVSKGLTQPREKNIYQKLIHDADCLDIIRARNHFDATYLDFYQDIAKNNELAFEEMAKLISEARSIIDLQGDSRNQLNNKVKTLYECENGYKRSTETINDERHPLMYKLHERLLSEEELSRLPEQQLLDKSSVVYNPENGATAENLKVAMDEGKLFARGIGFPSATFTESKRKNRKESLADLELRKVLRRPGIATQTLKQAKRNVKDGNPFRSMTMIGTSSLYAGAGFLSLANLDQVQEIYLTDANTGRGKKLRDQNQALSEEGKIEKLAALHRNQKMGGSSRALAGYVDTHNEVLYHPRKYDAIFYTPDQAGLDKMGLGASKKNRFLSPLLQAIYLQNAYAVAAKVFNDKCRRLGKEEYLIEEWLPIYEYSGKHNYIRPAPEIKEEDVIAMWKELTLIFMKNILKKRCGYGKLKAMTIDNIKTLSIYQTLTMCIGSQLTNHPADNNYSHKLQNQIDTVILAKKEQLLFEKVQYIRKKIKQDPNTLLTKEVFFVLLNEPIIREEFKKEISQLIAEQLVDPRTFFNNLDPTAFAFDNTYLYNNYLLEDKEGAINTNPFTIKEYYKYSSIRLYELAKRLDLPEAIQIREAASTYAIDFDMKHAIRYNMPFRIIFDIYQVKKETKEEKTEQYKNRVSQPKKVNLREKVLAVGENNNPLLARLNRQIQPAELADPQLISPPKSKSLYQVFVENLGQEKMDHDPIFTKTLLKTRMTPGVAIIKDLTAINSFYCQKIMDTRYSSEKVKRELDLFYQDALDIRLSDNPSKQQMIDSAHKHFQHRDSKARILADALMVISSLFGVGLLVVAGRVLSGRTLFFSKAPTARETELRNSLQMG